MVAPSSGWYNDAEFSDLTLELSDGRQINVHKLIICKQNEYFRMLCGSTASFREAGQSVVKLQEDDADAVEEVLRKIYGCTLPAANTKAWRFWFNLISTADKYLEPELSATANNHFQGVALKVEDADVIFDIVQAVKSDLSHLEPLLKFAEALRKKHLKKLLKNERYRALLVGDSGLMLAQLDELEEGLEDLKELVEKVYFVCDGHEAWFFKAPGTAPEKGTCAWCGYNPPEPPRRIAYLPKQ